MREMREVLVSLQMCEEWHIHRYGLISILVLDTTGMPPNKPKR